VLYIVGLWILYKSFKTYVSAKSYLPYLLTSVHKRKRHLGYMHEALKICPIAGHLF